MIFISDVLLDNYQFYQLGTGRRTQKAKPVQGLDPKPRIHTLCVLVMTTNYISKTSNELGSHYLKDQRISSVL